ncbi:hypothetical protein ACFVXG_00805 [Kitasatospora sp. NPDC058162]|uniref:Pepco domain-containing protein n=1 Tax=Kitasatospora sp. NPDC058162 TaxID=3346362 RepID=UPI0036DAC560
MVDEPELGAESESLVFWVTEGEEDAAGDSDSMGMFRRDREAVLRRIPVGTLRNNLEQTVDSLQAMFEKIAERGGPLPLKEVQLSFEVSAKGGIQLVGSSEVKGTRGITFVFGK